MKKKTKKEIMKKIKVTNKKRQPRKQKKINTKKIPAINNKKFISDVAVVKHYRKKIYFTLGLIIIIAVLVSVGIIIYNNMSKERYKHYLEKQLTEMGKAFYEEFYFEQVNSMDLSADSFLAKYKTIGIKISLDCLGRYNNELNKEIIKKFVSYKTNEDCDHKETMIVIYPSEPYGKKDYTFEPVLSCHFEDEETK